MSAQPLSSPQLPALRAGLAGVSSCPCQPGPRPPWGTSLCRPQHHSLLSVLLSRTIMSPMWLCPHLRMVCTGGCNWVHSMGLWGGAWLGPLLPLLLFVPVGQELWASSRARRGHDTKKTEVLGDSGCTGWEALSQHRECGQGAPSLQAQGTRWCWHSTTTRQCTLGT